MLLVLMILEIFLLFIIIFKFREKKKKRSIKQIVKELKPEQYVVIFLYLAIFIIAGYFLIANLLPNNPVNTSGVYTLSASDLSMENELKGLYMDKDVLGGKTKINNETVRLIISEGPFNIVFNPKKVVSENISAIFQLSVIKPETDIYFNDNLIIPNLKNYEKIKGFEDEEIWIKKELTKSSYQESDNAKSFVYNNFPGNSIYSFAELKGGIPIIQDYKKTTTRIDTQFRDNLKLAVYVYGNLNIEFTKQDLNWYVGKDEYNVKITNYQGEEVYNKVFEDDGIKKDTGEEGDEQDFEITLNNLDRNIYYIEFIKDDYNKASDSSIKDIEINSNKILILDKILPLNEFDFYVKVNSKQEIGFNYWWESKQQKIRQTGTKTETIDLDEDWKSKRYEQELEKGEYNFEINEGMVNVYSNIISPSKENWFYFPKESDKKLIDSDVIIIDKNKLDIENGKFTYNGKITIDRKNKYKIQVLDKLRVYFKEIKLILKEDETKFKTL